MKAGDKVELQGYDLMAVVNYYASGSKAVVVHNNSTHILLLRVDETEPRDGPLMAQTGVYVAAWRYFPDGRCDDSHDFAVAYKLAVTRAIGMAVGELSDGS